jgi:hypothetical protein
VAAVSAAECRTGSFLSDKNGASGTSDMAGKAATGSGRAERERARYNGASGTSDMAG